MRTGLGTSDRTTLLVAGLVLFSILHSALASDRVRARLERRLGSRAHAYRMAYNGLAVLLLLAIGLGTRGVYPVVWRAAGPLRIALLGVQVLAAAGFAFTVRSFDVPEFLGLRPGRGLGPGTPAAAPRAALQALQTTGVYALCRHPLYLFTSAFFSAWPTMDLRWFIVAVWLWAYSYAGSFLEERKLVRTFGGAYVRYQATHWRLLPLGRRGSSTGA